jgi:arylformamidase
VSGAGAPVGRGVYRGYDQATLEAQFRLDMIVDLDAVMARRAITADAARRLFEHQNGLRYAEGDGRTLDFYPSGAATPSPLQVFIHGGFWHSLDAALFAFLAPGFVPFGASLAVIDYPLMPRVRLPELVAACGDALSWLNANAATLGIDPGRIHVSGNSAGGHLVAEMLSGAFSPAAGVIAGGCAVSGLFDLVPVQMSAQNDVLALTDDEVRRFSPLSRDLRAAVPLIAAVGGDEAPEFLAQTAEIAEAWRADGGDVEHLVVAGTNHVTVVLDALADPEAELNRAVRRQMGIAR